MSAASDCGAYMPMAGIHKNLAATDKTASFFIAYGRTFMGGTCCAAKTMCWGSLAAGSIIGVG